METNFFNWFTTENVEVMEGNSHQKPAKIKGKSITDLLPKVLKTSALVALISTSSPAIAQDNVKSDDVNNIKKEQPKTQTSEKDDGNTLKFFNVADIQTIKQDGSTYYLVDGKAVLTPEMLNSKELNKKYRKGEKELRNNAEEDRLLQDTIPASEAEYSGMYDNDSKNIKIPFLKNDLRDNVKENLDLLDHLSSKGLNLEDVLEWVDKRNDQESVIYKSILAHEEQHRSNDKLGVYAPGLNPEQYAIINQYDEVSSRVAALGVYVNEYQNQIKKGSTKEEALEIFNDASDFRFYKEALQNGLDPQSKEGKAIMVSGCIDLWKNEDALMPLYKSQIYNIAAKSIDENSLQSIVLGNEKELEKRIDKIFDNILVNDKTVSMKQYLPKESLETSKEIKENLSYQVREKTGLDAEDIASINKDIKGKTYKEKAENLIKSLRGIDSTKADNPNLQEQSTGQNKTATKDLKTTRNNMDR